MDNSGFFMILGIFLIMAGVSLIYEGNVTYSLKKSQWHCTAVDIRDDSCVEYMKIIEVK